MHVLHTLDHLTQNNGGISLTVLFLFVREYTTMKAEHEKWRKIGKAEREKYKRTSIHVPWLWFDQTIRHQSKLPWPSTMHFHPQNNRTFEWCSCVAFFASLLIPLYDLSFVTDQNKGISNESKPKCIKVQHLHTTYHTRFKHKTSKSCPTRRSRKLRFRYHFQRSLLISFLILHQYTITKLSWLAKLTNFVIWTCTDSWIKQASKIEDVHLAQGDAVCFHTQRLLSVWDIDSTQRRAMRWWKQMSEGVAEREGHRQSNKREQNSVPERTWNARRPVSAGQMNPVMRYSNFFVKTETVTFQAFLLL